MLPEQKAELAKLVTESATDLLARAGSTPGAQLLPPVVLERPRQSSHGDLSCNLAMQLARPLGARPRDVAESLVARLRERDAGRLIAELQIAGPGFINLTLQPAARREVVRQVLARGVGFGCQDSGGGQPVLIEFVSANPTGPLHVGHGRQAALGDALSAIFQANGWRVTREFYYNDAGAQIDNLARSVQARALGIGPGDPAFPADGYRGDYIADIARDYLAGVTVAAQRITPVKAVADPQDLEAIRAFAVAYLRREQDLDLQSFGVRFDVYSLESALYTEGKVEAAVQALVQAGKTYEHEGALWLRTTEYGDDKDRVMRKSEGGYTYFVPDVAYHVGKWTRGFHKAINIQGSDHHGTIARVRAGLQALGLGIPAGYPDYVLHKMVTVMRGGEEVRISKRAGSYVTLRDLIEWSGAGDPVRGRDAVRFFLISRKADSEFVFDVDLALARSDENPVYYVQYAHARICSVLAQWAGEESMLHDADLSCLSGQREFALMARLADYPGVIRSAAEDLAPHALAFYLKDLAAEFHAYYNAERFLVDERALREARLALLLATRQVFRNGLGLLGVSAPERM